MKKSNWVPLAYESELTDKYSNVKPHPQTKIEQNRLQCGTTHDPAVSGIYKPVITDKSYVDRSGKLHEATDANIANYPPLYVKVPHVAHNHKFKLQQCLIDKRFIQHENGHTYCKRELLCENWALR